MQQERAGESMTEDTTPKRRPRRRKEVAALPEDALLGRWGGEEFIAILDGVPGREPASVAEAMRAALAAAPVLFEGTAIPVTVSIGVATAFAADGIDTLLAEADAALYRAKGAGRNRVVYGRAPVALA